MDQECSICLENLNGTIVKLYCNHIYHGECLEKWFNSQSNSENICPQCNLESEIKEIVQIPIDEINNENNEKEIKEQPINNDTYQNVKYKSISSSDNEDDTYLKCCSKCCIIT